jgi:hypothetical protein
LFNRIKRFPSGNFHLLSGPFWNFTLRRHCHPDYTTEYHRAMAGFALL